MVLRLHDLLRDGDFPQQRMRAVHRIDDRLQPGVALEHFVERAAARGRHSDDDVVRRVPDRHPLVIGQSIASQHASASPRNNCMLASARGRPGLLRSGQSYPVASWRPYERPCRCRCAAVRAQPAVPQYSGRAELGSRRRFKANGWFFPPRSFVAPRTAESLPPGCARQAGCPGPAFVAHCARRCASRQCARNHEKG